MRRISPGDGATLVSPHLARPDPVASLRGALEEGPMKRSLPADRSEWTPEETKDFLEFYAGVLERESQARTLRQPEFSADLRSWADRARNEAGSDPKSTRLNSRH